jgi:hypothetical protein
MKPGSARSEYISCRLSEMKSYLSKVFRRKLTRDTLKYLLLFSSACLLGLAWFLVLYGRFPLYISHVNWIYVSGSDGFQYQPGGTDTFQHQLGWEWFRQEPWRFPLGKIDAYGYPFGTSVTFMDSIPLMAIPFKLLSPWLPRNFQYLGLWELASLCGQMLFGMLILKEYTKSISQEIIGASLLVLSPPFLLCFFYAESLTAQWILLAAIWFIILEYRHKLWRGAWLALFAVTMLVHIYFVAMLMPLWLISTFFHYKNDRNKWFVIVDLLAVISLLLLIGYGIGLFGVSLGDLGTSYGFFSWNLNGFINPLNNSTFLKSLEIGPAGQYEGFSYLGLGNLFILPVALLLFLQKDYSHRKLRFLLPLGLIAILYGLFALTNQAFLNSEPLWNIPLPQFAKALFSVFRASGRFIWPVFYFLVLFGLISIIRNIRYPSMVLLLAVFLQFIDVQPMYATKRIAGFLSYRSPLQSELWQYAAGTNQHIILIPATESAEDVYEPIALYARENKLTVNWGYFARGPYEAIEKYAENTWEDLKAGRSDNKTIYIFWDTEWKGFAQEYLSNQMLVCEVDGFSLIISMDNKLTQTNIDLPRYCSVPPHG